MRKKEWRLDVGCKLPQVLIVPRRIHGAIDARFRTFAIPSNAESIAIGRFDAHTSMQTLIDQRVLGSVDSTLAATEKFRDSLTGRKRAVHLLPVLAREMSAFGVADLATPGSTAST